MPHTEPRYNRVLLDVGLFMRPFRTRSGQRGSMVDASSLQFIIEELIAHSAVEIGMTASSVAGGAVNALPPVLRNRVKVLDEDGRIHRKCDALFAELSEELDLFLGGHGVGLLSSATQVHADASSLYLEIYPYLVAIEHEMEVSVPIESWASLADRVRAGVNNSQSRVTLAAIAGIARSYTLHEVPAPLVRSEARPQLIRQFEALVDGQAYRHMSANARLFGIPERLAYAKAQTARFLADLLDKPSASELLTAGSRSVSAATNVAVPDSESFSRVFGGTFLPPVVSLKPILARARSAWQLHKPPFVPLPGYEHFLGEDVEVDK